MRHQLGTAIANLNSLVEGDNSKSGGDPVRAARVEAILAGQFREKGSGDMGDLYRALTDDSQDAAQRSAWVTALELAADLIETNQLRAAFVFTRAFPDTIPDEVADDVRTTRTAVWHAHYRNEIFAAAGRGDDETARGLAVTGGVPEEEAEALIAQGAAAARTNKRVGIALLALIAVLGVGGAAYGVSSLWSALTDPRLPSAEETARGISDSAREVGAVTSGIAPAVMSSLKPRASADTEVVPNGELAIDAPQVAPSPTAQPDQEQAAEARRVMACTMGVLALDEIAKMSDLDAAQARAAATFEVRYERLCGDFRSKEDIWLPVSRVPGHGNETARCAGHAANLASVAASVARAFCSPLI